MGLGYAQRWPVMPVTTNRRRRCLRNYQMKAILIEDEKPAPEKLPMQFPWLRKVKILYRIITDIKP